MARVGSLVLLANLLQRFNKKCYFIRKSFAFRSIEFIVGEIVRLTGCNFEYLICPVYFRFEWIKQNTGNISIKYCYGKERYTSYQGDWSVQIDDLTTGFLIRDNKIHNLAGVKYHEIMNLYESLSINELLARLIE